MNVSVRMYCHGLGDCFLVRFGSFKIVIDCGIVQIATNGSQRTRLVVEDIARETEGEIDLLVITHEHNDHMSGFIRKEPAQVWGEIQVKKLWLAWTEDPSDEFAQSLRATRRKTATLVSRAAAAIKSDLQLRETLGELASLSYRGSASGSWMDTVQESVRSRQGTVEFRYPREVIDLGERAGGVQAIVLGPPHDGLIGKSNPSAVNPETYELRAGGLGFKLGATPESIRQLGLFLGLDDGSSDSESEGNIDYLSRLRRHMGLDNGDAQDQIPFGPMYRIAMEDVAPGVSTSSRLKHLSQGQIATLSGYLAPTESWRRIDDMWLSVVQSLGLKLDSDTNNTSLALMFRLPDGRCLLFPGDAQVGSWLSWWSGAFRITIDGQLQDVSIKQLLDSVIFYKVGHHGSHNATLQEKGLELMPDGLIAMVPVVHEEAVRASWGNNIPRQSIMNRLRAKCRAVVRTDDDPQDVPPDFLRGPIDTETHRPLYYEWILPTP